MTWEAWLGVAAFVILFSLWSLLPSRFLKRTRGGEEAARPAPAPPSESAAPPVRARPSWAAAVQLQLVRNPAFGHGADRTLPRYFYVLRNGDGEARLPVYWEPRPTSRDPLVREVYRVRVAGRTLEAGNLHVLGDRLRDALGSLLATGQPPRFWLVNGTSAVPVYREGEAYVALTDGPRLWGKDLAELVGRYAHYLASCNGGRRAPVSVALFSPADLDVHWPELVWVGPGVWVPVFGVDGRLTAFGPRDRTWSVAAGPGAVLELWERVGNDLVACGLLQHPAALWGSEVSDSTRGALLASSEPTGLALRFVQFHPSGAGRVTLPIRRLEGRVFASCGELSCLHVAPDPGTLREYLFAHLAQAGVVAGLQDVVLEEDGGASFHRVVRAERLPVGLASSHA
ncbi:MAG: hypothetical protein K6U07_04765 [Firmicutes bacterium]|nr:hypothetical protein [Bacillota bacterium]